MFPAPLTGLLALLDCEAVYGKARGWTSVWAEWGWTNEKYMEKIGAFLLPDNLNYMFILFLNWQSHELWWF